MNEILWMKLTLPIVGMDLSVSGRKGPSRGKILSEEGDCN
jgi:hypothetical protein